MAVVAATVVVEEEATVAGAGESSKEIVIVFTVLFYFNYSDFGNDFPSFLTILAADTEAAAVDTVEVEASVVAAVVVVNSATICITSIFRKKSWCRSKRIFIWSIQT